MKDIVWSCFYGEGTVECTCDQCDKEYDYEFGGGYPDWKDCQEELKNQGWISKKINDEWYDFCCEECYYSWIKKHK